MNPNSIFIMRGVPGSGKSTVADVIAKVMDCQVLSTDNYFIKDGVYTFDRDKLGHYHKLNQAAFKRGLDASLDMIVDNTNITYKEVKEYVALCYCKINTPLVTIVEPLNDWCKNADECFAKNTHGVPLETIQRMLQNFESPKTLISKIERDFGMTPRYLKISIEK